jgi:hypothetical protein
MKGFCKPWVSTTLKERICALEVNVTKTEGMKVRGGSFSHRVRIHRA